MPIIPNYFADRLKKGIRAWYGFRWRCARPLLKSVPLLGPLLGIKYGDLLLTAPAAIGLTAVGALLMFAGEVEDSGGPPTVGMAFVFLFACHNSFVTLITGIPFERALFYHKLAYVVTFVTGAFHMVAYIQEGPDGETVQFTLFSIGFTSEALTGLAVQVAFLLLGMLSFSFLRRSCFEIFYSSHWILILVAGFFALVHGAGGFVLGGGFWLLDVVYRYFFQALCFNTREVDLDRLPSDVMRVSFPRGKFEYKSGQYVFICIPSISTVQWHPFSISSAPHEERVTLHIRVLGNWTRKLYGMAERETLKMQVFIEGPYGEPAVDIEGDTYDSFLMISGGIGITPMQSITNDLVHQYRCGRQLRKIWFVWSVRDRFLIDAMYNESTASNRLPLSFVPDSLESISPDSEDVLYTEFYLTKAREEDQAGANIHPDVQTCLRFGRPALDTIIGEMANIAKNGPKKRVAVLVCGPESIIKDVRRFCRNSSSKEVQFDVHSETFNF